MFVHSEAGRRNRCRITSASILSCFRKISSRATTCHCYSAPNQREETRVAVLLGFVPREAQLLHYYQVAEKDIAIHEIPDDFFANVLYHGQPETPRIGTAPYECYTTYPEAVAGSR
jgi:hypothetical protein